MTNDQIAIVTQLQHQGLGYRRIAALTNISVNTVKGYCKRHPVNTQETEPQTDAYCKQCGRPVYYVPHRKAKQFCSDKCRMAWWNNNRNQVQHKVTKTVVCCLCGRSFVATGKRERKFCSKECFAAAMRKEAEK